MHTMIPSFMAASCSSLANLFFRTSSRYNCSANAYLVCYYFCGFICSLLFCHELFSKTLNATILCIGIVVGVLNVALMQLIFQALSRGPAGLTFAFQNASSIFPNLILFLIFGQAFFGVTSYQILGMILVLAGMYLASAHHHADISKRWFIWACSCFLLQVFILTIFHWRCLFYQACHHLLVPASITESEDSWFLPGVTGGALIFQTLLFLREKRWFKAPEMLLGSLGGITNGIATNLLVLATRWALPLEKGLIFPLFSVGVITLCNLWGYKLYQERINIKANALCILGIIVASLG